MKDLDEIFGGEDSPDENFDLGIDHEAISRSIESLWEDKPWKRKDLERVIESWERAHSNEEREKILREAAENCDPEEQGIIAYLQASTFFKRFQRIKDIFRPDHISKGQFFQRWCFWELRNIMHTSEIVEAKSFE